MTIDAALKGEGKYAGKAYFFIGNQYLRYDWNIDAVDSGYPLPIAGNWPGIPDSFSRGIDAALNGEGKYAGKAYFFKGDQYLRYDWNTDAVDSGYPLPIAGNWPGIPDSFSRGIDAALNGEGKYAGKAYFFKGDQYLRYDWNTDAVDSGYPLPIAGNWPGLAGGSGVGPSKQPPAGSLFAFELRAGEAIGDRIIRCCFEALADGPMGQHQRHDFYREFISCRQEKSPQDAERLTGVKTSCAMFVRAVRHWCGANPTGPYRPGTGMFVSMGNVSFSHPAFVPCDGRSKPKPGDYFYIASTQQSNDGHTGIFIEEIGTNEWRTAEGGGGDGTECRFTNRKIVGKKFQNDGRSLWGWFDCTKVGLPST